MEKLRELLEKLKSGEASVEDIESAVESHVEEQSEKLKGENYKLRQERRELRDQLDSGEGKGKPGASKEVYELQDKVEELEGQLQESQRALEKEQKAKGREVEKLTQERDTVVQQLDETVVDQQLNEMAAAQGVTSDSIPAFKKLMRAEGAKLERSEDGSVAVKVGEKALDEFVEEWKTKDPFAKRIMQGETTGSTQGAPGRETNSARGGQGKSWKDMSLTEKTELAKTDPDTAAQLQNGG